jgi:SMI1/KNR4 family protein SUKH-1
VVISGSLGAPTERELAAIEAKLGVDLPSDLVSFLNDANGRRTIYSINVPPPDGEPIGLARLYGSRGSDQGEGGFETFI